MEQAEMSDAELDQKEREFIAESLEQYIGAGLIVSAEQAEDGRWTVTYYGAEDKLRELKLTTTNEAMAFLDGVAAAVISVDKIHVHNRITIALKMMAGWATFRIESIADFPEYRWELRRSDGEITVLDSMEAALTYLSDKE